MVNIVVTMKYEVLCMAKVHKLTFVNLSFVISKTDTISASWGCGNNEVCVYCGTFILVTFQDSGDTKIYVCAQLSYQRSKHLHVANPTRRVLLNIFRLLIISCTVQMT